MIEAIGWRLAAWLWLTRRLPGPLVEFVITKVLRDQVARACDICYFRAPTTPYGWPNHATSCPRYRRDPLLPKYHKGDWGAEPTK